MHLCVDLWADEPVEFVSHLKCFIQFYSPDFDNFKGEMRNGFFFSICALIPF